MSRPIIDLTAFVRWMGPPVGIVRALIEYARYAAANIPDVAFTIFDPRTHTYRQIAPEFVPGVLAGTVKVDLRMMPDATGLQPRSVDRVPKALHGIFWWVTKSRPRMLGLLENRRLRARSPATRARLEAWQAMLMRPKDYGLYHDREGARIATPTLEAVAPSEIQLTSADTLFLMSFDWLHVNPASAERLVRQGGARLVALCHDIIPIQSPAWFGAKDVTIFTAYWNRIYAAADRIMFTANRTADDVEAYAATIGVKLKSRRVTPLGSNIAVSGEEIGALPEGLTPDRYLLFVSTVEPRKNHMLLLKAWRQLIADGTIGRTGFKLVLVGRPGWIMNDFFEDMEQDASLHESLIHLTSVEDSVLAAIYRDAAFCVYPSLFEGYGLPLVEALAWGKALIASNAGPMPEVVGDFAVCLDPTDAEAWTDRMRDWIVDGEERRRYAARAKAAYRQISWEEAGRRYFEAALD